MSIPPSLLWGADFGSTPPQLATDVETLFIDQAEYRWYEEKSGAGRWMYYDLFKAHTSVPYTTNWISSLGIPSFTTEIM